ncbi:MAG: alpha/beta fold hydrolase [Candidatus Caenarcaniphilales bacterium]|nr:alpha/beta fold hydrolase [Candidatus Caenarcaniphilales bacterium]
MNPSKKDSTYLTTSLEETVYVENNFSTISSQKSQIVAVHGIGTYSGWFDELTDILADRQIASTTFDLPGFGRSGERGCLSSYKSWTEALSRTWAQASEISPKDTFLLGHSLGGVVSLASFANLEPKPKGIILVVPGLMANPQSWHITNFVLPTIIKALQNTPEKTSFPFPSEVYESVKQGKHKIDMLTTEVKPKLLLEILNMTNEAWFSITKLKDVPILMILSEEDPVCISGASKLFFNFCNSRNKTLKVYPSKMHDLFILPEANEINELIANWITNHSI